MKSIEIHSARIHNLKSIDVSIPNAISDDVGSRLDLAQLHDRYVR